MTAAEQPPGGEADALPVERRAELMSQMRAEGRSLQEIGQRFGLTRERVRQIIRDAGGPTNEEAAAARREAARREREALREQILQLLRQTPGLPGDAVAEVLGVSTGEVRAALGDDARRILVSTHRAPSVFADQDILDNLRQAAQEAGEPLTVRMYEEARVSFGGASAPLVLQRFGTWRDACVMAGVQHGQPVRTHYERRWTRDDLVDAVVEYLAEDGSRGSFADYERWARRTAGKPSGQTIRTQLGTWSTAKTAALTRIAQRPGAGDGDGWPGAGMLPMSATPSIAATGARHPEGFGETDGESAATPWHGPDGAGPGDLRAPTDGDGQLR